MSERWLLAVPLLAAMGLGLFLARRLSALHPLLFALLLSAAAGAFYPLATLFVAPITWRSVRGLPEEVLLGVQADYLAFGLGLLAAVVVAALRGALRPGARPPERTASERRRDLLVAWGLVVGGALLYALYVRAVGLAPLLNKLDLAEKYRVSAGLGPLMFGLNLMIVGVLWAEASFPSARAKLPFRLASLAIVVWSVAFIAVRSYSVAVLLGHIYLFCERRRIQLRSLRPRVLAMIAVLYVVSETYAQLRGNWNGDAASLLEAAQNLETTSAVTLGQVVGGSELSHPFITAMELARYEEAGALRGQSYLESLATLVPLALQPDRPPTLAQSFAAEYYPLVVDRGGGTAFSLVGEAWWNLGALVGPFVVGLGAGLALVLVTVKSRRAPHGFVARLVPYGLFLVLGLHRSTLGTTSKQLLMILGPTLLLALCAELLAAAGPFRRQRSAAEGGRRAGWEPA